MIFNFIQIEIKTHCWCYGLDAGKEFYEAIYKFTDLHIEEPDEIGRIRHGKRNKTISSRNNPRGRNSG